MTDPAAATLADDAEERPDDQPAEPQAQLADDAPAAVEPAQPVTGELITAPVGSAVADLPIIPPDMEMRHLAQLANTLALANVVPKALYRKPNDVFAVLLTARDTGVALTVALREFHVIEGRVTLSPKVKLAMVRRAGLGRIWPKGDNDADSATWYAVRSDMPDHVVQSTFTWADAQRAGLVDTRCTPTTHWKPEQGGRNSDQKCMCKDNWKRYPQRMLSWRAAGYLLDDVFPDVGTGLYSPDELGAVTDEDGAPIDVAAVKGLPGMKGGTGGAAQAPDDPPASDEDKALVHERIGRLTADARAAFGRWWAEQELPKVDELLARNIKKVSSRLDWQERQPGAVAESPAEAPADGAGAPEGGETPADAPAGQEDPVQGGEDAEQDGTPVGWVIRAARDATPAALRAEFRAAGMKAPTGSDDTVRRAWCEWRLAQLAAGTLAALTLVWTGAVLHDEDDVAEAFAAVAE